MRKAGSLNQEQLTSDIHEDQPIELNCSITDIESSKETRHQIQMSVDVTRNLINCQHRSTKLSAPVLCQGFLNTCTGRGD